MLMTSKYVSGPDLSPEFQNYMYNFLFYLFNETSLQVLQKYLQIYVLQKYLIGRPFELRGKDSNSKKKEAQTFKQFIVPPHQKNEN